MNSTDRKEATLSVWPRLLLLFVILGPFSYIFIYIWNTASEIVFRDDMYLIRGGFIENYVKGTLSFADLWRPAAATRILGHNLLQLANIKWFAMQSRLLVFAIPFLLLGSALLIFRDYKKSLAPEKSPQFIAMSYLVLTLIIFNLIQWEGLTFGYALVFQTPMPFFIATFVTLEALISTGKMKYWPIGIALALLAILVFGGTHSFSFAVALCATFLCYVLTRWKELPDGFWLRSTLITVFLAIIAFLYLYQITKNDYFPDSLSHLEKITYYHYDVIKFLLAAMGASVVGVNAVNLYFSFHGIIILGLIVFLFYGLAIFFFFKSKMYHQTYLPFLFIIQTLAFIGFMTYGRFQYGIDYGMASRYTCVSIYGILAITWVLIFVLSHIVPSKMRFACIVPILLILAGVVTTAVIEWRIQPYRKDYFNMLKQIALRVDTATAEELAKFEERPELVRDSLMLLRDYRLNIYHEQPSIVLPNPHP